MYKEEISDKTFDFKIQRAAVRIIGVKQGKKNHCHTKIYLWLYCLWIDCFYHRLHHSCVAKITTSSGKTLSGVGLFHIATKKKVTKTEHDLGKKSVKH
jgi:hypothetical protein